MTNSSRGFTLVELLVVITVLSVLLAMLMPALRRVRHIARTTVCLSHHKQIGLGLLQYAGDHRGWWPDRQGNTYPPSVWGDPDEGWDMHETIERYIPPGEIYVCPQSARYNGKSSHELFWPLLNFGGDLVFKWPDYAVWAGFDSANYKFFDAGGAEISQAQAISMRVSDGEFIAPLMTCRLDIFTPDHPVLGPGDFRLSMAHAPSQFWTQMPDPSAIAEQELNALWPDGSAATYTGADILKGNRQTNLGTIRHWAAR